MKKINITVGDVLGLVAGLAAGDMLRSHTTFSRANSGSITKTGYSILYAYVGMKVAKKVGEEVDRLIEEWKE